MYKITKKITSALVSVFMIAQACPGIAESNLKSFSETFEEYTVEQDLTAAASCSAAITNASAQSFTAEADPANAENIAGCIYDGDGKIGNNVNARISFDDMDGMDTHGIVTIQFRIMFDACSKYSSISINDGSDTISRIAVVPGLNNGLQLQSPSLEAGAGGEITGATLSWGTTNIDGNYMPKDQWQSVKYQLNFKSQTFAMFFNGTEKAAGAFNSADADSINSVCIGTGDGEVARIFIDDIYAAEGSDLSIAGLPSDKYDSGYTWNNVPIGGGGFVTGLVVHPTEPDLVYCRTDVGGAYRWNPDNQTWIPLTESFNLANSNFYGVDGIAIDPNNPDIVYIAAGKASYYQGDVLKSYDRGKTWIRTYFHAGTFDGNGAYRGCGECIMVDPLNSDIVYCGTYNRGLWKSTNGGFSWEQVVEESSPVRSVVIYSDPADADRSSAIYAGTSANGLYISQDGGETWINKENAPGSINRMAVSKTGRLYIASSTGLFKYENNIFTEISPVKGGSYNDISIDSTAQDTIMVLGPQTSDNYMTIPFYRSTDGGETWTNMLQTCHVTSSRSWDNVDSVGSNISSNSHSLVIDPVNPKRVWLSDWFGVYKTDDITSDGNQDWTFLYNGLEEMVPRDFICPAEGQYRFIAGVADNDGLLYSDYHSYPDRRIRTGNRVDPPKYTAMMSTNSLDYCISRPNFVVRVGIDWNCDPKAEISLNGMKTWRNIIFRKKSDTSSTYNVPNNGLGQVAVSSDVNPDTGYPSIVVIPKGSVPLVSDDLGETWETVSGITDTGIFRDHWNLGTHLAADTADGSAFYIQDGSYGTSRIYRSSDYGHTWTSDTYVTGQNQNVYKNFIKAAPGMAGEVWSCTAASYLYRSSDGARSFTRLENIGGVQCFGFGKNAPDSQYPTVYAYGTVNGICGMYRSTDMGENWTRINDDDIPLGCGPIVLEGDMRTFGVVYLGTSGRGIYYGEPKDIPLETPTPAPTAGVSSYYEDFESYEADTQKSIGVLNYEVWEDFSSRGTVVSQPIEGAEESNVLKVELPANSQSIVDMILKDSVSADKADVAFRIAGETGNDIIAMNIYGDENIIATIGIMQASGTTYNNVNLRYSCKVIGALLGNGKNDVYQAGNMSAANIALLQSYPSEKHWYNIRSRFNFEKQTFDAILSHTEITDEQMENPEAAKENGEIIGYILDIPFANTASNIEKLSLYAPYSINSRICYFDDIKVTYDRKDEEPPAATPTPETTTPPSSDLSHYEDFEAYAADTDDSIEALNDKRWSDPDSRGTVVSQPIEGAEESKVLKITIPTNSMGTVNMNLDTPVSADNADAAFRIAGATENETVAMNIYGDSGIIATMGLMQAEKGTTYNNASLTYPCKVIAAIVGNGNNDVISTGNISGGNIALLQSYPSMNHWYNIRVRFNFGKQTYNAIISNTEITDAQMDNPEAAKTNGEIIGYILDIPFANTSSTINKLSIYAPWGPGRVCYFDNISVTASSTAVQQPEYSISNAAFEMADNEVSVTATITKGTNDADIIAAAYAADGTLAGLDIMPASELSGSEYSSKFAASDSVYRVSIMIWNLSTLKPECSKSVR